MGRNKYQYTNANGDRYIPPSGCYPRVPSKADGLCSSVLVPVGSATAPRRHFLVRGDVPWGRALQRVDDSCAPLRACYQVTCCCGFLPCPRSTSIF